MSFIVTGTAWKWLLNPSLGVEQLMRQWGFEGFSFDWLIDPDKAIYCIAIAIAIAIAGVRQSAGFVTALFLAGLRGIDDSFVRAVQIDGTSLQRIYWRILIPSLRPVFFSTLMVVSRLVPELRVVPEHERRRQHRLRARDAQGAQGRARGRGAASGQDAADRTPARAQARRPVQWPAPARRDGPSLAHEPKLSLFDEPLSNLDAKLRVEMRAESVTLADHGVPGNVIMVEPTGPETYALIDTAFGQLLAHAPGRLAQPIGDVVHLAWRPEETPLFF